ncbi:SafA/ExsA family spore coat assembly protein [Sporosarcina sp. Marseille-Q4063]|uniref:SafA/ExsA family spore coat assembly protein n=1 Tax=Sporosarcina sp. Marseille-Q4063 TaxID=2810514 RepID=UPI001BB043CB|nr:SafA/ExsA family spore coat assembly protein [Sporosarcina sp. Marseille-Q4063]QUW22482.1 SafA/ExsA family spore coat assembly protein [Sporosarcina sp. Marseille-Q4063]
MEVHVVQKGDTLWKISRQFGVSFDELKRVNAHLANPDYIVPGMKITLPAKSKENIAVKKPAVAAEKKMEKAPIQAVPVEKKPAPPVQLRPVPETPAVPGLGDLAELPEAPPMPPVPMPEVPKAPAMPKMPKAIEVEMPEMPPMPPMPEMPPQMQQPMQQMPYQMQQPMQQPMPPQFFGVPCGWMPIYDADCYPFIHPAQMQQPMPFPTQQLPVEMEASPMMPNMPVAPNMPMMPNMPIAPNMPVAPNMPMREEWQMIESPNIQFEEDIKFQKMPNIHFEESPTRELEEMIADAEAMGEVAAEKKVESIVEEDFCLEESPMMPMGMSSMPPPLGMGAYGQFDGYSAYPSSPCGCGHFDCGCGQPYPQMPPCGCGQGQMYPVAPVQQMNYCNSCNQPIQAMPYHHHHHQQMMPYPYTNWPGNY